MLFYYVYVCTCTFGFRSARLISSFPFACLHSKLQLRRRSGFARAFRALSFPSRRNAARRPVSLFPPFLPLFFIFAHANLISDFCNAAHQERTLAKKKQLAKIHEEIQPLLDVYGL